MLYQLSYTRIFVLNHSHMVYAIMLQLQQHKPQALFFGVKDLCEDTLKKVPVLKQRMEETLI